ncbi:MAG: OB-fold nucleic acid binding domain-containing protein, partial [Dehalococcoidales bacterium]|nr:OB-fold nucleic acid binding domain-containing protein [Dehalococcoidales bacterium]
YRPGPMEHIPTFIRAKHGEEEPHYPHPALEKILKETYGVIVYQEQVLFIVQALAGYSLGQADIFRKAMGKKIAEVMKKEKQTFFDGAQKLGFSPEIASEVFTLIEPFAGYAFNKAHAFSYALVAYQTAYLKANYPAEYMTAFLIAAAGQLEKVATAVAECYRLGIEVLPPDINHSEVTFAIEKSKGASAIRFGLAAIKNVGEGAVEPIIAERSKGGHYKSIEDFARRCDLRSVNRRVMESLIKAGAFDILGIRGTLLNNVTRIISLAQREQQRRETGQATMFDLLGDVSPVPLPSLELLPSADVSKDMPAWEKELMGISFSEKPFSPVMASGSETMLCGQVDAELDGKVVVVAGRVASVRELFTRDQRPFASAVLADISGQIEVMVWPRTYAEPKIKELWQVGSEVVVEGKVKLKDDRVQLGCDRVRRYQPTAQNEAALGPETAPLPVAEPAPRPRIGPRLVISMQQTEDRDTDSSRFRELLSTLGEFPGRIEVRLNIVNDGEITNLSHQAIYVDYCLELQQRLAGLVGADGFQFEPEQTVV